MSLGLFNGRMLLRVYHCFTVCLLYSKSSLFARVAFLENLMISETVLNKTYFPIETNVLKGGCIFGSEFFGHKHKFLDINTNKQNTLLE